MSPAESSSLDFFTDSLPPEYRERFDLSQIAIHAVASVQRGPGRVTVQRFPWAEPGTTALCVIADDRPGLLADISATFAELGFDVDAGEAYTRDIEPPEAVDVFWLRDPDGDIDDAHIQVFAELLEEILAGRPAHSGGRPMARVSAGGTTVRFLEDASGLLSVLEVETDDRSGLLSAITRALYEQKVQIVSSRVRTQEGRVHDSFTITELDGRPIAPERRLHIQVALLSAIQMGLTTQPPS